ncbi:hypothetical protein SHIRM173S_00806 [Streptomyces hirsutus]
MGLRSGAAYLEGLRDGRSLYINGERVDDVTAHPAFQGVLTTLAGLYDAQLDPEFADVLTVWDGATGEAHSTTLLEARTHEDVLARLRCDRLRTELTYGMMGRLPDFMNAYLLDVRSSLEHVGKHEEAARMGAYLARLRQEDLAVTHTLVDPQSDRSTQDAPPEAVRIVERREDGFVIRGARLLSTLAPVAEEVFVGPYVPRRPGQEDYALVCTLPLDAPGLKIVCRQAYDRGDGLFDTPLSGRFDEGDAILVFDARRPSSRGPGRRRRRPARVPQRGAQRGRLRAGRSSRPRRRSTAAELTCVAGRARHRGCVGPRARATSPRCPGRSSVMRRSTSVVTPGVPRPDTFACVPFSPLIGNDLHHWATCAAPSMPKANP